MGCTFGFSTAGGALFVVWQTASGVPLWFSRRVADRLMGEAILGAASFGLCFFKGCGF